MRGGSFRESPRIFCCLAFATVKSGADGRLNWGTSARFAILSARVLGGIPGPCGEVIGHLQATMSIATLGRTKLTRPLSRGGGVSPVLPPGRAQAVDFSFRVIIRRLQAGSDTIHRNSDPKIVRFWKTARARGARVAQE